MATKLHSHQNHHHLQPRKANNLISDPPFIPHTRTSPCPKPNPKPNHSHTPPLSPNPKPSNLQAEQRLPDLTVLMNEWFFGSDGGGFEDVKRASCGGRPPLPNTGRLTREWIEEANRRVASEPPSRRTSPTRSSASPRFSVSSQAVELPQVSFLHRRDAFSRSARRNRLTESISDEILHRSSARHNRNMSDFHFAANCSSPADGRRASSPFFNPVANPSPLRILPNLPPPAKNRFHENSYDASPRRTFRATSPFSPFPLSPPRDLPIPTLSRSTSSSTYSVDKDFLSLQRPVSGGWKPALKAEREDELKEINAFLRKQSALISKASSGEVSVKAMIILSSYTPDTSSMVAAICYAWLMVNSMEKQSRSIEDEEVVVPVINMKRAMMWEHKQAAWLFHHIGIDASALIFSDELDLEGLLMGKQLSLFVVGQDVLQNSGKVGSLCTILTDNYCEDAYELLLQTPNLKKFLLAGILLDTQNLSSSAKSFTNRDAEAVQLLLVGSSPGYRDFFFELVMKEHEEESFLESLRQIYGVISTEVKQKPSAAPTVEWSAAKTTSAISIVPYMVAEQSSRPKNKFFLGRLLALALK